MNVIKKIPAEEEIWDALKDITDPEIPVVNIVEMGIVREVTIEDEDETVSVHITPTYSGCPAMIAIKQLIEQKLRELPIEHEYFEVSVIYDKAWTTDWMTDRAKHKLKEYGIAPPAKSPKQQGEQDIFKDYAEKKIECPYCDSKNTKLKAEFGSTACKAQYFCQHCHQPFEYFKCH